MQMYDLLPSGMKLQMCRCTCVCFDDWGGKSASAPHYIDTGARRACRCFYSPAQRWLLTHHPNRSPHRSQACRLIHVGRPSPILPQPPPLAQPLPPPTPPLILRCSAACSAPTATAFRVSSCSRPPPLATPPQGHDARCRSVPAAPVIGDTAVSASGGTDDCPQPPPVALPLPPPSLPPPPPPGP